MNKSEICRVLEADFAETFIGELIPGILHNFANPLNGIMGRSKLMQRRMEENIKKIEALYPDVAEGMMDDLKKIKNDIQAINQESEYFFDLFKDVSGKFYAIASPNENGINLSQLLAGELRFFNFYLDFKHEIKKNVQWDSDIPELKANHSELSLAFWKIIRFFMLRTLKSNAKEFYIRTDHDSKYVKVAIRSSDDHPVAGFELENVMNKMRSCLTNVSGVFDQAAIFSFFLLEQYGAKLHMESEENFNSFSIQFPYRA